MQTNKPNNEHVDRADIDRARAILGAMLQDAEAEVKPWDRASLLDHWLTLSERLDARERGCAGGDWRTPAAAWLRVRAEQEGSFVAEILGEIAAALEAGR